MKKHSSTDYLASSMQKTLNHPGFQEIFTKPIVKKASIVEHPISQAFKKLLTASAYMDNLGFSKTATESSELLSRLSSLYEELSEITNKMYGGLKTDKPSEFNYNEFYDLDHIREQLKEKIQKLEDSLPHQDLMDRAKETDLDPEELSNTLPEYGNLEWSPALEEYLDDPDDEERLTVSENPEKSISDETEYGSLFDRVNGDK